MNHSRAWDQVVTYWECPECSHIHSLGEGVVMDFETETECDGCHKKTIVHAPGSDTAKTLLDLSCDVVEEKKP